MAIVSRLELNHPALGTAGGPSLHASIESLYQKIGDSVSSRWFTVGAFNQTETVDLDHNFSTDVSLLQVDILKLVGGEWEKADLSDFTLIEKVGDEGDVLQLTNDTAGNGIEVAVSVVFNPLFLSDGDIKDVDVSSVADKDVLVYDSVTKKFLPTSILQAKVLKDAAYGEESLAAATSIAPENVSVRITSGSQIDMIDPATTKLLVLSNVSGGELVLSHLTGATAANQIDTGIGGDLPIPDNSAVSLIYDATSLKWRVYGGSGSGGGLAVQSVSSSQTLEIGNYYLVDSDAGGLSFTLPDPTGLSAIQKKAARITVVDSKLVSGDVGKDFSVSPHSGGKIALNSLILSVDEAVAHDIKGWLVDYAWDDALGHWRAQNYLGANYGAGGVDNWSVGDVRTSLLTETQFQNVNSTAWVLMSGQDVTGSQYHIMTGNSTLPDVTTEGKFLRSAGGLAAPLGTSQAQATAKNGLGLTWSSANVTTSGNKASWSSVNITTSSDYHTHTYRQRWAAVGGGTGYWAGNNSSWNGTKDTTDGDTHSHVFNKNLLNSNQSNHTHYFNKTNLNTHQIWAEDAETRPTNLSVNYFIKIN